ncbi:MAG: redoxin domain-containing protein [Halobacteriota archaeon]
MVEFDVVEFDPADTPAVGELAPDFTRPLVTDEYWEDTALSDVTAAGPTLLVFYSMNGAFPATYVWNEIRDREWSDRLSVVGITISTPYDHAAFLTERSLDVRLFSDPSNEIAATYGVAHDLDGMTGVSEPRLSCFLLDTDRTIRHVWVAEEWPEFPDYDELDAAISRHT